MRTFRDNLGDPSLHLLAIALILIFLALGRTPWSTADRAEDPLPVCKTCHAHYIPGGPCECRAGGPIARAWR